MVIDNSDTHTSQSLQATLCIERALHLTLPLPITEAASAAITPAAASHRQVAVAFEWGGVAHTTPAVVLSHAGSATWQHDVALLVAEAGVSCGKNLEPALLRLQVCSQNLYATHSTVQSARSVFRSPNLGPVWKWGIVQHAACTEMT